MRESTSFFRALAAGLTLLAIAAVPQVALAQGTLFVTNDRVGINTATPATKFHIENVAGNDSDDFTIDALGTLGIGTETPNSEAVQGGANFRLGIINTTARMVFEVDGSIWEFDQFLGDFRIFQPGSVKMRITPAGNIHAAGSFINGGARGLPDYVFEPDYKLMPIEQLREFVATNKHLPNVPSSAEVEAAGEINMSDMQLTLLEKIEELALYTLDQQELINQLQQQVATLMQEAR